MRACVPSPTSNPSLTLSFLRGNYSTLPRLRTMSSSTLILGHPEMSLSPLLAANPLLAPSRDGTQRGEELCPDITWMISEWRSNLSV